jgi:hypothetical protein
LEYLNEAISGVTYSVLRGRMLATISQEERFWKDANFLRTLAALT